MDTVFALPLFGGFALSLLAVIAAILQFVQVKMTSPRPNPDDATSGMTSTMTYTFPLLTIVWGGIFPSGLILYWIVYTSYLVVQQYLIMGWGNLFPIVGWQPSWAHTANGTDTRSSRSSRLATDEPLAEAPPAAVSSGASASGATAAGRRPTSRDRSGSKRRHRRG